METLEGLLLYFVRSVPIIDWYLQGLNVKISFEVENI
jgi:hypothetical protein